MKKVASVVAIIVFAVGLFATQMDNSIDFGFDIENMLACDDCNGTDSSRGGNGTT